MYVPLAEKVRPLALSDVFGQKHILSENGLLRRVIESGNVPNMIFYGPSGTGKTTVAGIIADKTRRRLYRLNATTAGIADIKAIIDELDTLLTPSGILLYLDEIQYFNKKQQQSLLEFIENGKISLIASTTENPYFYIYNAILSRSTVFEFRPLSHEDIRLALLRAASLCEEELSLKITAPAEVFAHIAASTGGDARKALNALELLIDASRPENGEIYLALSDAEAVSQRSAMRYDRDGDARYDILSALHKSLRGSDPDAAVHYLARLLEAGDLISACRRLLACSSEDVGLAYPQLVPIVKSCVDTALQLGLPEARLPLAEAALLIATAPKSNSVVMAIDRAIEDVRAGKGGDVPAHLKDAHYGGAEKLGRGIDYKYPHSYKDGYVCQQYLPDELSGKTAYYQPGKNKAEQTAAEFWKNIKSGG